MVAERVELAIPMGASKRAPAVSWVVGIAAVLLIGTGVGWALATVFTPPDNVLDSTSFTYVEVAQNEVGSSVVLNTVAAWSPVPVASNLSSGIVTTVNVEPGQKVGIGSILYTVNLRPVVIAQGSIPSFQSLSEGARGADVAQLQSLLTSLGFYGYDIDGHFDRVTLEAVKAWQASLDLVPDGTVHVGDIVYVPMLPTRISLDPEKIKSGTSLTGGEEVVRALPVTPTFLVPVTTSQAGLMPTGTRVEISGPSGEEWQAFVVERVPNIKDDGVTVTLAGSDGAAICTDECDSISVTEQVLLRSRVVTVEAVAGLAVPSAALLSRADDTMRVVDNEGAEHQVQVVTSAKGMSVITGVPAGMLVRVPAAGK